MTQKRRERNTSTGPTSLRLEYNRLTYIIKMILCVIALYTISTITRREI